MVRSGNVRSVKGNTGHFLFTFMELWLELGSGDHLYRGLLVRNVV